MSESKFSELIKKRGVIKGRLTLFDKFVKKFKMPLNEQQSMELTLRIDSCANLIDNFHDIQSRIEDEVDDDEDMLKQIEERESFEDQFYKTLASAKLMLVKDVSTSSKPNNNFHSGVRLPDIKIPTFDGSYDCWLEFKNSYVTMIHDRDDLNSIQKFHYLKSSLTGNASQVISALEFTPSNYSHAWDLLENRFNNNRLLVHNHVKSLFTISSLNKESAPLIRKLIDTVLRNLRALQTLGEPTDSWDTLIIFMIVSKLDQSTEREWEHFKSTINSTSLSKSKSGLKLDDLLKFLKDRADMLEMIKVNTNKTTHDNKPCQNKQVIQSYVATHTNNNGSNTGVKRTRICTMCGANHSIYSCSNFLNLSIQDRLQVVNKKKLCNNCLRVGHAVTECYFGPCRLCNKKHNSLLHVESGKESASEAGGATQLQPAIATPSVSTTLHSTTHHNNSQVVEQTQSLLPAVLLSTALVDIADSSNDYHTVRVLLDNGSQHCFITKALCDILNVPMLQSTYRVTGVGHNLSQSTQLCKVGIRSKINNFSTTIDCLVLPRITNTLPTFTINTNNMHIPDNIPLADPTFYSPADIDILIGADKFWDLLNDGRIRLSNGPYLQNTKFGWVMSGPLHNNNKSLRINQVQCNYSQTLDTQLKQFWELEEIPNVKNILSTEEQECENIFMNTTKRTENGRFSVRIPLKEPAEVLGNSYKTAERRLLSLERKFERQPDFKKLYVNFMHEYESLGHMSRISTYGTPHYFLPHHGVINENSSTTKLRTVFDASAATSTGKSLNHIQYIGPPLQNDIFSILLRFRQYKYVACADVEKMYRQILVQADQRSLQLILWRDNPTDSIGVYRLNTVTYGTASAPFLSLRCLKQVASECNDELVARVLRDDSFVDDVIFGNDNLTTLLQICENLTNTLKSACFPLRKWLFNTDINVHDISKKLSLGDHCQNKTLGLGWYNKSDDLHFTTKIDSPHNNQLTKRIMLSIISQIYDPLGILAPTIIVAKIIMQKLWLCKIGWDDPVPNDVIVAWNRFINNLRYLPDLRIPRHVIGPHTQFVELHIFTDASQSAYGTCAYVRTYSDSTQVTTKLLCAKSKVAPLKPVSIPRLELCGALLGARLYRKITDSLRLNIHKTYLWTDSTIVLGWLRMSPQALKTFVQNRVVEINELTSNVVWSHIDGKNNPADLVSRGCSLDVLSTCDLWWTGPAFLQNSDFTLFPQNSPNTCESVPLDLPEVKPQTTSMVCGITQYIVQFNRFSSFDRMKRATAYVLRFIRNARTQTQARNTGPLSVAELTASLQLLTRLVQVETFPNEYSKLKLNLPLPKKGAISRLNIFLDENDIIRVGGRLSNSPNFEYDKRHPILLSSKHYFTLLLFQQQHKTLLHAGPQLLLSTLRENWWPLGGRSLARQVVHACVQCTRIRGITLTPIMGNLPASRLEPGFAFIRCGVDYAGPLLVLSRKGRGAKLQKCYICLFVCFATRAIHLELVGTLSSEDYLLALKRFISRRGKPLQIYSDNGKNFVGAMKELSIMFTSNSQQIIDTLSNDSIEFKFIPPYSPHFGGLWEAGVKSCKHHLRRVVGTANLTYEEFSTVLTQIEAVLNSRPISPLSTDPHDLCPLTPAHFLIGRPLTSPAVADVKATPINRLTRFKRIEQIRQHFWTRWTKEYVSELQIRSKWKTDSQDIALHTLVLIKEDGLPPMRWRLGRVLQVFVGRDGVTRVATLHTSAGPIQRAFSKICPLPIPPAAVE